MKKTTTILAAVGGVTFVAVAAAGFFAWSAQSAKTAALEGDDEGTVGLEEVRDKADRLSRKPVYPGAESIKALTEARESLVAWKDEAFALASRGDRKIQPTTDAAFKEFIVGDARRLLTLPAGEDHKTLDATFDFGPFKPYISEGKMPEQATLPELQRKWDDVVTIIETLSASGVENISSISVKAQVQPEVEETKPKKGKKPKKASKLPDTSTSQPLSYTYVVACKTRPAAFVKALNALATSDRFMSVEDMSLRREKDALAEGLGAEKKDEAAAPATGRRRRRSSFEQEEKVEEKKTEESLYTVITDPATDLPLDVQLTVTVYDFRSLEENKEGEVEK